MDLAVVDPLVGVVEGLLVAEDSAIQEETPDLAPVLGRNETALDAPPLQELHIREHGAHDAVTEHLQLHHPQIHISTAVHRLVAVQVIRWVDIINTAREGTQASELS